MSEPEVKLSVDGCGRISCRVTHEGLLLSKEEKEQVIHAIEQLKEENAKLRDDVERMFNANVEKNGEITRLLVDNIKMRELIHDLLNAWDDMQHEVITGPTFDECERRAYELGMEVN